MLFGLFVGFVDLIGGGGWGLIMIFVFLVRGNEVRKVIGFVDMSEFFVLFVVIIGFFILFGWE